MSAVEGVDELIERFYLAQAFRHLSCHLGRAPKRTIAISQTVSLRGWVNRERRSIVQRARTRALDLSLDLYG